MINKDISVGILAPSPEQHRILKTNISRQASSVVFICSSTATEFKRKFAWFPPTFIMVEKSMLSPALYQFLQQQDVLHKLIITSTRNEDMILLPEKLKALYFFSEDQRRREETKRIFGLKKQKEELQRKLWTD